ncbi:MAG: peptide MFS transporter, partial [Bacteroidia bacterium]|nr:peptide MFS transporter [Bacteroidia bacterium]
AILVLYCIQQVDDSAFGGLGWSHKEALALYGWYTMLVYLMSIPGGILADKVLGQKKAVMLGGLLLCAGHGILAVPQIWSFYTGLLLIILGVGCLKPNISTMVGGLYGKDDSRRDKGFSIFYIGINVGAAAASIIVGLVAHTYGWHYGFGLAGIGMLLGQLTYSFGLKYLVGVGEKPSKVDTDNSASIIDLYKNLFAAPLQLVITALLLLLSLYILFSDSVGYGLLGVFITLVIGLLMMIYKEIDKIDKDRFVVLLLSFVLVMVFWAAFEQAGGLMNIYTQEKTNRFLWGWELPAEIMQSFNPIYIIIFGVPIANFWYWMKKKGLESSSLFKMIIGTIIMGLGFIFMRYASLEYEAIGESALYWLAFAYLLHTIGELCASPVALSFITKLAPVKYASLMMGVYFAATGLGNKIAGRVGESASDYGELSVFTGITIFCVVFGLIVMLALKPLKRLTHGAEENEQ